jgi:leader peptidase (prepilin peptidase) / N-methyltransferase
MSFPPLGEIPILATLAAALSGVLAGMAVRAAALLLPERVLGLAEPLSCPECGTRVPWMSQLPGVGAIRRLKGEENRCSGCGTALDPGFPVTEAGLAALFAAAFAFWGGAASVLWLLAAATLLAVLVLIDLEVMIVPDVIVAALAVPVLGLAAASGLTAVQMAAGVAVLGAGAFLMRLAVGALKGREPLGLGDVKLLVVLGLATPPASWGEFMLVAGIAGIVTSRLPMAARQGTFPFAPALAAAFVAVSLLRLPWR